MKNRSLSLKKRISTPKSINVVQIRCLDINSSVVGSGGPQGTPKSLKKAKNAKKNPKTRKICLKTRIIGGILSRFFLVQALGA